MTVGLVREKFLLNFIVTYNGYSNCYAGVVYAGDEDTERCCGVDWCSVVLCTALTGGP